MGLAVDIVLAIASVDLLAIIPFGIIVILGQWFALRNKVSWSRVWLKGTIIGFIVGLIISIIVFIVLNSQINLTLNHAISSIVHVSVLTIFQFRTIKNQFQNASVFVVASILSAFVGLIVLGLANMTIDLDLDVLTDGIFSSDSAIPWGISGLILGTIYGFFTGYCMSYIVRSLKE